MQEQNFQHHTATDNKIMIAAIIWLIGFGTIIVLYIRNLLGWEWFNIMNQYFSIWIIICWYSILPFMWLIITRSYATKLQDRIIRQEVQFRHFVMTNKIIDTRITMKQMVALRFASDIEFLDLCEKAATQHLEPKIIKSMIKQRTPDHVRV